MQLTQCEVRRDVESGRLWVLQVVGDEITGCCGPFAHDAVVPESLEASVFERNTELIRWLRGRLER